MEVEVVVVVVEALADHCQDRLFNILILIITE